jgi:uncharacterized membrane protein
MVFLVANVVIALAIFHASRRARVGALGFLGALLWLLNRWTLHVSMSGDVDLLALSFLVVSAVIHSDRPRTSLLLFGISTAVRHLALGLAPIWLISSWRKRVSSRERITDVGLLISVPILTSLPLFMRSPNAMVRAILNAWTRPPEASGRVESLAGVLGIPGVVTLVLLLAMLALVYIAVGRHNLSVCAASMLALGAMVGLSSVFFTSYMVWVIPFLPLAALESLARPGARHDGDVPSGDSAAELRASGGSG